MAEKNRLFNKRRAPIKRRLQINAWSTGPSLKYTPGGGALNRENSVLYVNKTDIWPRPQSIFGEPIFEFFLIFK